MFQNTGLITYHPRKILRGKMVELFIIRNHDAMRWAYDALAGPMTGNPEFLPFLERLLSNRKRG